MRQVDILERRENARMDAGERRERASADTHGPKDVRRGVGVAVFGGIAAFAGLAATDSLDAAVTELWIVLLTIIGAFVVRPLVEFAWNYAWTPWRVLCEQVEALSKLPVPGAAPRAPQPQKDAAADAQQFKAINARLRVLRPIEAELRAMRQAAAKALDTGAGSGFQYKNSWDIWADVVGSVPDWKSLFETLRASYEGLSDLRLSYVASYGGVTDANRERLEAAMPLLDSGLGALEKEIGRLSELATR